MNNSSKIQFIIEFQYFQNIIIKTLILPPHIRQIISRLKIAQRNSGLTEDFTIHCFRHSHVSLLIELGYSALMIANRIGDTVETTLKTYSHLYPDKQVQLVNKLEKMNNSTILVPQISPQKKAFIKSMVFSINYSPTYGNTYFI